MTDLDDPGAFLNDLAERQWETAARHAWKQYQARGRGAIVFSLRNPGAEDHEPLRYLTFSGDESEIEQSAMAVLHRLVKQYDPREEVVIAAVLPDDRTVFDVYERSPTPAELAAANN